MRQSGVYPTEGYFAPINGVDNPQSVSIGKNCYAVLGNGTLYRWGVFSETDEVLNPTWKLMLTPQKLNCYYKYKDVDSYRTQTLAIDENNEVWAWGEGYYGDGTDKMVTHYSPVHIDGLENIIQISRGKNHNLALDSSGNVWAWGSNSNYPMGSGLGGKVKRPTVIMSNVKQISAGTEYSVFLKNDGTIWGVGKNDEKQLCDSSETYYSTPIKLSDKSDFVFISSDDTASAAIDANGTVYAWGSDQAITQITADFTDGESTKFTEVSVGEYHYLALTDAGYVYSWGKNYYGQLGVGDKVKRDAPTIVRVSSSNAPLTNVRSVYAGARQSLAITNDGKIYGFGSGACYQLAMSNRGTIRYATLISALQNKNIVKAGTGYNFSVALDADGNIYTFGDGESGALGIYQNDASVDGEINEDYLWLKQQMNAVSQPITSSITLPSTAPNGSSITWISSNTYYIADDGTLVNRPDCYGSDTDVKLTATITNGAETVTGKYTITVKQDPTIKPSTDIPIRSIGFEYDQIYPNNDSLVAAPEINAVTVKIIDEQNGKYRLSVKDDQYNVDDNSTNPFFFWSAREGTFLPDNTCSDYSSVYFTVDESALNKKVKVIVGVGDGLGYVDKKAIILQGEAAEVETQEAALSENAVALAVDQELSSIDVSQVQGLNLAIGIDMSKDMIEFDAGGAKTWTSVIEGLINICSGRYDFRYLFKSEFQERCLRENSCAHGTGGGCFRLSTEEPKQLLALIENTVQMLDQNNSGSNSAVIFVKGIEDAEEIETKIAELELNGTAVYVMVLGGGYEGNNENIINCLNELELRLNVSRLYEAFSNISALKTGNAALLSADGAVTLAANDYVSDFKTEKHKFNTNKAANNFGKVIASILNLYGCLPAIASKTDGNQNSYDLFDDTANVYQIVTNNAHGVNVNDNVNAMFKFYDEMKGMFIWSSDNADDVIERNLRYRFPVVASDEDGDVAIITGKSGSTYSFVEYGADFDSPVLAMDTYQYLLDVSKNAKNITDKVSENEAFYSNIRFLCPSGSNAVAKQCVVNTNGVVTGFSSELTLSTETISENGRSEKYAKIDTSQMADNTQLVAVVSAKYSNGDGMPDLYNTNRLYRVIKYDDLQAKISDAWFYKYLFKATNLGIINGIEEADAVNFAADSHLTRGQLITMVLRSADVNVDDYATLGDNDVLGLYTAIKESGLSNSQLAELGLPALSTAESTYKQGLKDYLTNQDVTWAKNYMNFAYKNGLINALQYLGLDYFTNSLSENDGGVKQIGANTGGCNIKVRRDDAAYIMCSMYVNNILSVNVPMNIYKYSHATSCEKNTYWNTDAAFADITRSYPYCIEEIYQMYMNGIMVGDTQRRFNPSQILTRAEACTAIVRCLFEIDENIEQVYLEFQGYDNILEFDTEISQPSDGWKDEYYIYAPRSGYYFIKVKGSNLSDENYVLSRRVIYDDDTFSYENLIDDHMKMYDNEELPDYITSSMNGIDGDGCQYIYKRYYIDEQTGLRLSNLSDEVSSITIQSPQNGDVVFSSNGDGKYIFSNSPETITEDYVADGNGKRYWIMNNYGLTKGNYSMTLYHHTDQLTNPVYVDAKFYAEEDTTIVVNRFGFGKPSDEWASLNIYADYLGSDILAPYNDNKSANNRTIYYHSSQIITPKTINISAGECIWLSDIHNMLYNGATDGGKASNYPRIGGYAMSADGSYILDSDGNRAIDKTPVFGMADFAIISGFLDIDILAYRNRNAIDDSTRGASPYIFENHHKGIADSLPRAEAKLHFEIDDDLWFDQYDTAYLKGRVFPEKNPLGTEVYTWVSHINSQSDIYTDNTAVESDMFALKYADPNKINFYASDIPSNERNDIWEFDTIHTQIRTPELEAYSNPRDPSIRVIKEIFTDENEDGFPDTVLSGFKPNDFIKNMEGYENPTFVVSDECNDYKLLAASLGNYGVVENYVITVTNTCSETRYLNYKLTENSNIVINRNGEYVLHNSGSYGKDDVNKAEDDTGVEYYLAELPAGETTTVEFSITLPTADNGGIENSLVIKKTKMGIGEEGVAL